MDCIHVLGKHSNMHVWLVLEQVSGKIFSKLGMHLPTHVDKGKYNLPIYMSFV